MQKIIEQLERNNIFLALHLEVDYEDDVSEEDANLIKTHKQELISYLAPHDNCIPTLPWQLRNLLSAASSKTLSVNINGVTDVSTYVLAYVSDYLVGDREHALSKLWEVSKLWQEQLNQAKKRKDLNE